MMGLPLRKKCSNTEFFLARIFLYSEYIPVFPVFTQCPSQASMIVFFFAKIVNDFQLLIILPKSSIIDGVVGSKYTSGI